MNIKKLIFLAILIMGPGQAYGAGVIIDGTDAAEHGMFSGGKNHGGWLYMQNALDLLAMTVPPQAKRKVVILGVADTSPSGVALRSAIKYSSLVKHWDFDFVDGEDRIEQHLTDISIENTGILVIPTFGHAPGDIQPGEMAVINRHDRGIARFSTGATNQGPGGALFAMGETSEDADGNPPFRWLRALFPLVTVTDLGEDGVNTVIEFAGDGAALLTDLPPSELALVRPWHNYFEGDFTGLQVIGNAPQFFPNSAQVQRDVILASRVTLADLAIEVMLQSDPIVGTEVSYTITVSNKGPTAATAVTIKNALPPSVKFVSCSSSGNCVGSGNEVMAMRDFLPPGAVIVLTVLARIECGVANNTLLSSSATVESPTPDPNLANNSAIAAVRARAVPPEIIGQPVVEFSPVTVGKVPPKIPQEILIPIVNPGLCEIPLRSVVIKRTGDDVDTGKIINPNGGDCSRGKGDCKIFSVTGGGGILPPGDPRVFSLSFKPVIPPFTGKKGGLPSNLVLPEDITSDLIISGEGGAPLTIELRAHIRPAAAMIDPNDPRGSPVVSFSRAGDNFIVEFTVYDSNPEDLQTATYVFLGEKGLRNPPPVDLRPVISERLQRGELIRGRSFKVKAIFSAANDHKQVNGVEVTVQAASDQVIAASARLSASPTGLRRRRANVPTVTLPAVKLAP